MAASSAATSNKAQAPTGMLGPAVYEDNPNTIAPEETVNPTVAVKHYSQ
jgi:hypothetical protein